MRSLHMREPLPNRRRSWTQHVHIAGQSCYLCVGEYADGRPGEVFIDVAKQGTFLRGVMGTLARTISIALQCGAGVDVIIKSLRGLDYPPDGPVSGSDAVSECYSVTDWVAQELAARYSSAMTQAQPDTEDDVYDGDPDDYGYVGQTIGEGDVDDRLKPVGVSDCVDVPA